MTNSIDLNEMQSNNSNNSNNNSNNNNNNNRVLTINQLPNEIIDKVLRFLSFEVIAKNRIVRNLFKFINQLINV